MIFLGWIVIACTVCTVSRLVLVERAVWGATLDKHHVCLVFCIACICELPWDITMLMWTTIVNSLSQVADHPMSSPGLTGLVLSSRIVPYIWMTLCLLLLPWCLLLIYYGSTPHTWLDWTIQQAELFWLWWHCSRGIKAVQWIRWLLGLHLKLYRAVLK